MHNIIYRLFKLSSQQKLVPISQLGKHLHGQVFSTSDFGSQNPIPGKWKFLRPAWHLSDELLFNLCEVLKILQDQTHFLSDGPTDFILFVATRGGFWLVATVLHCMMLNFTPGPSCSKLTMSVVNISLKLWSLNMAYTLIFLLKNCE